MTNYWMLIGREAYSYFTNCTAVRLMIFQNKKMADRQNLKLVYRRQNCSRKYKQKHHILAKSLAGVEYDVYIENNRLQELDKALQSCTLRLVDAILSC